MISKAIRFVLGLVFLYYYPITFVCVIAALVLGMIMLKAYNVDYFLSVLDFMYKHKIIG